MDIRNRRQLKSAARHALAAASYDPRKIILIHTAVSLALTLIVNLIDLFISLEIENTGGLNGLGLRSFLSTAQSVLQLAVVLGLPFWEAGYRFAAMKMSRGEETKPATLLEGFRRFGPLLRRILLQALLYVGTGMGCFFLSMQIFMITPLSSDLMALSQSMMENPNIIPDEAFIVAFTNALIPMLLLFCGVFLVAMLVISYFFRMADYLLLDHPGMGALRAMKLSVAQMRGNKLSMLKLDLSFWWYYLLQILISLIPLGDYLLALFGVALPLSSVASYLVFTVLSLLAQFALYFVARNRVDATYAMAYDITALPDYRKN